MTMAKTAIRQEIAGVMMASSGIASMVRPSHSRPTKDLRSSSFKNAISSDVISNIAQYRLETKLTGRSQCFRCVEPKKSTGSPNHRVPAWLRPKSCLSGHPRSRANVVVRLTQETGPCLFNFSDNSGRDLRLQFALPFTVQITNLTSNTSSVS